MKRLRVYADTPVFGGCFDDEFADESRRFFDEDKAGRFILAVSATTMRELVGAPPSVRGLLAELPLECIQTIESAPEIERLRDACLNAGILGPAAALDAEHIAAASVAGVDLIVGWNFKHIVHYEKNPRGPCREPGGRLSSHTDSQPPRGRRAMKAKTFDCVKAKHEIQQRTLAETAGLSQEQRRREAEQVILTDPILGPVWRAARQITIDVRPSTGT